MTPTTTFTCNICAEPSSQICIYCTKDACDNHLCERCRRCSDCCECEVRLDQPRQEPAAELSNHHHHGMPAAVPEADPKGDPDELL